MFTLDSTVNRRPGSAAASDGSTSNEVVMFWYRVPAAGSGGSGGGIGAGGALGGGMRLEAAPREFAGAGGGGGGHAPKLAVSVHPPPLLGSQSCCTKNKDPVRFRLNIFPFPVVFTVPYLAMHASPCGSQNP